LLVAKYHVRFLEVTDRWSVVSATIAAGGSGTTNALGSQVTSGNVQVINGSPAQVNAVYTGPIDGDNDGIPTYIERGEDTDTDGDGVLDYRDIDSDNAASSTPPSAA
jgi:hypothetical protein